MQSIADLEQQNSTSTSLVSYYIKGGPNLTGPKLAKEISAAANIKSKETRTSVVSALKAIQQDLKTYNKIPDNGLCIFSGNGYYV